VARHPGKNTEITLRSDHTALETQKRIADLEDRLAAVQMSVALSASAGGLMIPCGIRCTSKTPRCCIIEQANLSEIRGKIEKHIKNTFLKAMQAPIDVKPMLKAWMELN